MGEIICLARNWIYNKKNSKIIKEEKSCLDCVTFDCENMLVIKNYNFDIIVMLLWVIEVKYNTVLPLIVRVKL